MAGVQGFEPRNGWTKTNCLTAWRYPNILKAEIIALLFVFVNILLRFILKLCDIIQIYLMKTI